MAVGSIGVIPPHIISAVKAKDSHTKFEVPRDIWLIRDWQDIGLIPEPRLPPLDIGILKKQSKPIKVLPGLLRSVYSAENRSTLPGKLIRNEEVETSNDPAVNEVYDNIGDFYEFLQVVLHRNSIDNKGMRLIATVHYKVGYDNAYWDGQQMVFGDGDDDLPPSERLFHRFTKSLTIASHEWFHGVIQNEVKLTFTEQSGALNESICDIFGSLVKQYQGKQTAAEADWIIGKSLFTENIKGVGIRSLKAPGTAYDDPVLGKDPQPAHMKDYVKTVADNGGVHINSGIPNHAFYVTARELGGYAWEKAGLVWYETLCSYLKSNSIFNDAAHYTYKVAGDKYSKGSLEQKAFRTGWAEVGITIN
jgi:Zn-dependent metalloprotease